ncbi:uncharacterized protein LOC122616427 [Drosophila teissieri]|uniref:uncharacterized protein LOC122616427 n=1 Tax=Drosophila teissieri TaxID=7243 RepID=UPI001CBA45B3|nr:uncharacterized protein LOC122616427 [Drosophila teissieri]
MDVLSHYSSPVVEFPATQPLEKQHALVDNCTGTDPPPPSKDVATGTQEKLHVATQTERRVVSSKDVEYDERALAKWLRQICPMVERELMNPTLLMEDLTMSQCRLEEELQVYTYQKLAMGGADNSQGLAIWLCVHTNNAPVLVATTVAPHDDWCEHVDQQLKLFVPQRMSRGNLVMYTEAKTLPLKSCLRSLCTNPFNKTMFAGSTMDGELFIWLYEQARGSNSSVDIKQLYSVSSAQGAAVALDWPREQLLLACFANGSIRQWDLSRQMALDWEYSLPATITSEPTAMLTLGLDDFVVGTNEGGVYRFWNSGRETAATKQIKLLALRRHLFMVTTLIRTEMEGNQFVLSCDLSGQAFYHDMRLVDEDMTQLIVQIPLPFKNVISCSRDGNIIYCPANDGSLEYYRVSDGAHAHVKGGLRGKGSVIRSSDNGRWLIAGLYGDEFQIFYVEY